MTHRRSTECAHGERGDRLLIWTVVAALVLSSSIRAERGGNKNKDPAPTEPPTEPAPEPDDDGGVLSAIVVDFERAPSDLPEGFSHSKAIAHAYSGRGSLKVSVAARSLFDAVVALAAPIVAPFAESSTIGARWYQKWNAPVSFDFSLLRSYVEAEIYEHADELSPEQIVRIRGIVAALEGNAESFRGFEAGSWYCFTVAHRRDDLGSSTELRVDGTLLVSVEGLSLPEDFAVIDAVARVFVDGPVATTEATQGWFDELRVQVGTVSCQ